jgi:type II secretion system protein G
MRRYAFTLIELLIVVAIIAILAAIAVPNFLEAQTRAKVSRTQADMRTLATAIELYTIDHNRTPTILTGTSSLLNGPSLVNSALPGNNWVSYRFRRLTTPIAYITTVFPDVFAPSGKMQNSSSGYDSFDYGDQLIDKDLGRSGGQLLYAGRTSGATWRTVSCGPDNWQGFGGSVVGNANNWRGVDYDATNGTVSNGDVVRVGGQGKVVSSALPAIDRIRHVYNQSGL